MKMKLSTFTTVLAVLVAAGTLVPSVADAANARHPYRHVNRTNDRGNRTGDSAVERLNQQQLDMNRSR